MSDYRSINEAAKASGIPATTLLSRMKRRGMSLEQAVAMGRSNYPAERRHYSKTDLDPDQYFIDALRHARGLPPLYGKEE